MQKNKLFILILLSIILCIILKTSLIFLENSNILYNAKYNYTIYLSYLPQSICLLFIIFLTYNFSIIKILKTLPKASNLNILNAAYLYIITFIYYLFYLASILFVEISLQKNYNILNYEFPVFIYKDFVVLTHTIIIIPLLSTLFFYHIIFYNINRHYSSTKSILITLFIFILLHIDPEHTTLELLFISIMLSYVYLKLGFWHSFLFYVFLNFNSVFITRYVFLAFKYLIIKFNAYIMLIVIIFSIILLAYYFTKILTLKNMKGKIK